jgi:hypothetical protein
MRKYGERELEEIRKISREKKSDRSCKKSRDRYLLPISS